METEVILHQDIFDQIWVTHIDRWIQYFVVTGVRGIRIISRKRNPSKLENNWWGCEGVTLTGTISRPTD